MLILAQKIKYVKDIVKGWNIITSGNGFKQNEHIFLYLKYIQDRMAFGKQFRDLLVGENFEGGMTQAYVKGRNFLETKITYPMAYIGIQEHKILPPPYAYTQKKEYYL